MQTIYEPKGRAKEYNRNYMIKEGLRTEMNK